MYETTHVLNDLICISLSPLRSDLEYYQLSIIFNTTIDISNRLFRNPIYKDCTRCFDRINELILEVRLRLKRYADSRGDGLQGFILSMGKPEEVLLQSQ